MGFLRCRVGLLCRVRDGDENGRQGCRPNRQARMPDPHGRVANPLAAAGLRGSDLGSGEVDLRL